MWTSKSDFKHIACPFGPTACTFPNCIFSHESRVFQELNSEPTFATTSLERQADAKHRHHNHDNVPAVRQAADALDTPKSPDSVDFGQQTEGETLAEDACNTIALPKSPSAKAKVQPSLPRTATRKVSPPPKKSEPIVATRAEVLVPLVPRKLTKEPAAFERRFMMLKMLHKYMVPLNDRVALAVKPETKALHLSANQLIKLAVEEEEKAGKEHAAVYDNVLKQRLSALSKMSTDEWVKSRRAAVAKDKVAVTKKPVPQKVDTGLSPKEEVIFLSSLITDQTGLDAYGYVIKKPTDAELKETEAAQALADFWEICDRCNTRFQVFPDRREEDGALTTGGACRHHWGRRVYPKQSKAQPREPTRFGCCNEPVGSAPCTTHDCHVYKFTDVKRLSLVMPFIETPENPKAQPHTAVCFDCEMGYTTHGFELLRLTVISWPSHRALIDVLVRPLGTILDTNQRFSGISKEQLLNAEPYDPKNPRPVRGKLRIVDSPYMARDLFLAHISPTTPVLGHALENDLNVIRLIHPTIVDTVALFPTPSGLPHRHRLKTLAKTYLGIDVQTAGSAGHDSYEDARTTGELVRFKVAQEWKKKKDLGWTIRDDALWPPLPTDPPPSSPPPAPSMLSSLRHVKMAETRTNAPTKRTFSQYEEDEGVQMEADPDMKGSSNHYEDGDHKDERGFRV